jgi:dolichol-phosphate mannosyltransferase
MAFVTKESAAGSARVGAGDLSSVESAPDLTVVVPTRNERDNVARLTERLDALSRRQPLEVLFVDDSADDTPKVIQDRARQRLLAIRLIHRPKHRRTGGLGGAVCTGLREARSEWVCVMDADLQHPPEVIVALVEEARRSGADVVVGSRYCAGGEAGELSALRRLVSRGSALVARALFPRRLRGVSDPMSGFFVVRRAAIDLSLLRPRGFKILLEILLCGRRLATSDVGYRFGERHAGESKASVREGLRYLARLAELRAGARMRRLARFGAVGAVGVVVNSTLLLLLAVGLHVFYLVASVLATQVAIVSNYVLSDLFVFQGVEPVRSPRARFVSYVVFNNCSLLLVGPLLVLLVSVVGMGLAVANVLSLSVLVLVRFAVADAYVWGSAPRRRRPLIAAHPEPFAPRRLSTIGWRPPSVPFAVSMPRWLTSRPSITPRSTRAGGSQR